MSSVLVPLNDDWGQDKSTDYPALQDGSSKTKHGKQKRAERSVGHVSSGQGGQVMSSMAAIHDMAVGQKPTKMTDAVIFDKDVEKRYPQKHRLETGATLGSHDCEGGSQRSKKKRKCRFEDVTNQNDDSLKTMKQTTARGIGGTVRKAGQELRDTRKTVDICELLGKEKKTRKTGKKTRKIGMQAEAAAPGERSFEETKSVEERGQSQSAPVSFTGNEEKGMELKPLGLLTSCEEKMEDSKEKSFVQRARKSKLAERLLGSKFRWLNERLYTTTGEGALSLMSEQPDLFDQYHKGFEQQTKGWPMQPVEVAVKWLQKQPTSWRVADFGCGNAQLAASVLQEVVSLDLVAALPGVIACNMSQTPLETDSVDVVVFCLALMGVDYPSYLQEGRRVLKPGGMMWIAEVRSRFAREKEEDLRPFVHACQGLGLRLISQDRSKMFIVFIFALELEQENKVASSAWPALKACLYKQR